MALVADDLAAGATVVLNRLLVVLVTEHGGIGACYVVKRRGVGDVGDGVRAAERYVGVT